MAREERGYSRDRDRDRDDRRDDRRRDRDDNRSRDRGRDDDRGRGRDRDRGGRRGGGRSYSHHNEQSVRKHSEQSGGSWQGIFKSGVKVMRPKEGENAFRILPPTWEGYDHYGFEVYVHSNIGASGSQYTCPNKHGGGPCAACAEAAELRKAGEDEDAGKIAVRKNFVYYILDRDAKKLEPQVWQVGWRQDKEIADASEVKRRNIVKYIDHPDEGYDLIVKRTGKQRNTRYTYQVDSDPSPICDNPDDQDDILKEIEENPIDSLIVWASNEKIANDLEGMTRKGDDDDDEGSNRRGARGRDRDRDEEDDRRSPRRGGRDRDSDDEASNDRRSSRGRDERGRDDDEEDSTSRRAERRGSRDRDEPDDDRRERRRGDDDDDTPRRSERQERTRGGRDDDDDRPSRQSRSRDDDDREERPSRRSRDDEPDDRDRPRRR